jgi:hypothetical protein
VWRSALASPIAVAACAVVFPYGDYERAADPDASFGGSSTGDAHHDSETGGGPTDAGCPSDAAFDSDPKNCGSCGRDCLGATCTAGRCDVGHVFINPGVDAGAGIGTFGELLLADGYLYFVDVGDVQSGPPVLGAVWRLKTDGSEKAQRLDTKETSEPNRLTLNPAQVFWTSFDAAIFTVQKTGLAFTGPLFPGPPNSLRGIAVDGTAIFFVDGNVMKRADLLDGGAPAAITPPQPNPQSLVLDKDSIYFTNEGSPPAADGNISHFDRSSQKVTVVAPNQFAPYVLAQDATHVYWTTGEGDVKRVAKLGTAVEPLATGSAADVNARAIALDELFVYWVSWGPCLQAAGCSGGAKINGRVKRAPKTGGATTILAEGNFLPSGVAVDDQAVYFTTWWFATVSRVAK